MIDFDSQHSPITNACLGTLLTSQCPCVGI